MDFQKEKEKKKKAVLFFFQHGKDAGREGENFPSSLLGNWIRHHNTQRGRGSRVAVENGESYHRGCP